VLFCGQFSHEILISHKKAQKSQKQQTGAKEWVQNNFPIFNHVIPAQAGNQFSVAYWFPACAGMTEIAPLTALWKLFQDSS
jgi:hypothetical protein